MYKLFILSKLIKQKDKINQFLFPKGGSSPLLFFCSGWSYARSWTLLLFRASLFLYLYAYISRTRSIVCTDFTIYFRSLFSCSHYLHFAQDSYVIILFRSVFPFLIVSTSICRFSSYSLFFFSNMEFLLSLYIKRFSY